MQTIKATNNTTPNAPMKNNNNRVPSEYTTTPRKINFDNCDDNKYTIQDPTPGKIQQPFKPIEWVYPNDGESEFYTYEQMQNDWVPSDLEDDSSSDEEENYAPEYETDQYW